MPRKIDEVCKELHNVFNLEIMTKMEHTMIKYYT